MRGPTLTVLSFLLISVPTATGHAAPARDIGIFSELDSAVTITLPSATSKARLQLDAQRGWLVLYEADVPLKAFPINMAATPTLSGALAALPTEAAAELAPWLRLRPPFSIMTETPRRNELDLDGAGLPNRLDVLLGARKWVVNHAAYTEGYYRIAYPQGDVPRNVGVCTDTIIRAYRNAGLDLQVRVAEDIHKAPQAYSIKKPDKNIDHRRVKTLLVWFRRHVPQTSDAPPRAGDVVFLDTFPSRAGPDHVGIISDRLAPSGLPFVINNWTVGFEESEMDLLPHIPVTHHFRLP
jgi:uncharacterized protein YijF (DUF1287 family)